MTYRLLNDGEIIREGDEIFMHNRRWMTASCCLGDPVRGDVVRRPMSEKAAAIVLSTEILGQSAFRSAVYPKAVNAA